MNVIAPRNKALWQLGFSKKSKFKIGVLKMTDVLAMSANVKQEMPNYGWLQKILTVFEIKKSDCYLQMSLYVSG
ncbi:hypothetical protein LC605_15885 [Nostoc sp. CHAB 5836]|nr:hypothetical protein [Nostoc sp. CHAB 5836]